MLTRVAVLWMAAVAASGADVDTDRDGITGAVEQALLLKFAPAFHISDADCDIAAAEFEPGITISPKAKDGTIYGQVSPRGRDIESTTIICGAKTPALPLTRSTLKQWLRC